MEAGRIISVARGEVDPTDDKQGRDNIKYRNEYSYEQNRRVDISFVFYAHDAQTINYEVVAPSGLTQKNDKYKNKICILDIAQSIQIL